MTCAEPACIRAAQAYNLIKTSAATTYFAPDARGSWSAGPAAVSSKAGHRSTLAFLRFCVIAATGIRKHTQVELLCITRRIRRISAFPSNSERLDASVFTSTLPATKRNSRTISTRATAVIFERKHCSRRRRHTQVEITSPHKQLGN